MKKNWWVFVIKNKENEMTVSLTTNMYRSLCELRQNKNYGNFKLLYTEKFDHYFEAKFKAQIISSKLKVKTNSDFLRHF